MRKTETGGDKGEKGRRMRIYALYEENVKLKTACYIVCPCVCVRSEIL